MITECQIKKEGDWSSIGFPEAVALREVSPGEVMRCPRCRGRVTPYLKEDVKPHFMHIVAHAGCGKTPPAPHPEALS